MLGEKYRLAPICSFEKQGTGAQGLVKMVIESGAHVHPWVHDLMHYGAFAPSPVSEGVSLTVLTVEHFGYKYFVNHPSTAELLDRNRLFEWSKKYLADQVITLCQPDDAFYFRSQYRDQPPNEVLAMAMQPLVIDVEKDVAVFHVDGNRHGERILAARFALPSSRHSIDEKWIFRLETL